MTDTTQQPAETTSEHSKDMELIAEVANRLVESDKRYSSLVGSMLASRQLYAMCLYELDRLCHETDFKKATKAADKEPIDIGKELTDDQALMLKEMLVNAAAVKAQQPFEENQLFDGMMTTVFPWMRDVVTKHNEAQDQAKKEKVEAAEQERRERLVDVGLPVEADEGKSTLPRTGSVLLVGERKLLTYLIENKLQESVKSQENPPQLLRLVASADKKQDEVKICFLESSAWQECAASNDAFQKVYLSHVLPRLNHPVDLLLVDDLRNAKKGLEFTSYLVTANESQKRLKRWAEKAGCLLVGCLPLDRQLKENELNLPDYETLRIHNTIRGVASERFNQDGKDFYRIFVGKHEACTVPVEDVDKLNVQNVS